MAELKYNVRVATQKFLQYHRLQIRHGVHIKTVGCDLKIPLLSQNLNPSWRNYNTTVRHVTQKFQLNRII